MTIKRRNKLPKSLKERCKKLRIRITKVRNGKRVYKTKKAILKECKKKLKRKIKRRRKFGTRRSRHEFENSNTGLGNRVLRQFYNYLMEGNDEQNIPNQRNASINKINKYMRDIRKFVHDNEQYSNFPNDEMEHYRRIWTRANRRRRVSNWLNRSSGPIWSNSVHQNLWCFYKHINENRIDTESIVVILFMAVCNSRQTLIAMDMLHDRKGESLSTGKQGTRELLENSLVQDNITETVIDSTTTGLTDAEKGNITLCNNPNNRFPINNIISKNSHLKLILTDFVKSQKINEERFISWLITLLEDSPIKSIFKPLFENNNVFINQKFTKTNTRVFNENIFNFTDHIVTLDGQLKYKNYIFYLYNKYPNIQQYFDFTGNVNKFTLQNLNWPYNDYNDTYPLNHTNSVYNVKQIIQRDNVLSHNIFSIIDGSNRGDTSNLNQEIVEQIHNSLFKDVRDNNPFYPFIFEDEHRADRVLTKKLTVSNSDFLYSLRPNQDNREDFFLRVGEEFNICTLQGLEGKICIPHDDIRGADRIGDARYILVDLLERDTNKEYHVTPIGQIGQVVLDKKLHYYDVDNNNRPFTNQTIKNTQDVNRIFIRRKQDLITIHSYELVLENEHISRWVCLKTSKTRKKFEKVLLGYLNNYTVNGIHREDGNFNQKDDYGYYENFNFAAREQWESSILPGEQGFDHEKNWGIIKIIPPSYDGGSTLIPNQYIYQKSAGSFIALVWYRPHGDQYNFKYMFIASDLPTNPLITDFSRVLQYNVISSKQFHVKIITSLWNYKRILDPLQYLGLRQHLIDSDNIDTGTFITADFMCFLQTYYLKRKFGDDNITIILEQDEDNIITTKFGTVRKNQKNIYTLIKEILEELKIETYFDFYITFNKKNKVFIRYFVNPYILEQYSENTIVKKNMDKILKQLGCKSFNQQITGKLRQMKKERVLEEQILEEQIFEKIRQMKKERILEKELKQREFFRRPFINSKGIYNLRTIRAAYGKTKKKRKKRKIKRKNVFKKIKRTVKKAKGKTNSKKKRKVKKRKSVKKKKVVKKKRKSKKK